MKIGIIAQGSHGDVEIMVALALGLIKRNHEVNILVITFNNRDYSFLNRNKGLKVYQKHVHEEFKSYHDALEFWDKPEENKDEIFVKLHSIIEEDLINYSYYFCENNDVVIGEPHLFELACVAPKFNIPYISVNCHVQNYRTKYEPPFKLSHIKGVDNEKLWDNYENYYNYFLKKKINWLRKKIGVKPIKNVLKEVMASDFLNLIPCSKHIYSVKPDWGNLYQFCGFWKSSDNYNDWQPPINLANFMESPEKPVFITVGSMEEHETNIEYFQTILLKTAHLIQRKVIILSNWKNDENTIENNVFKLRGFISYPEILRKCCLVVHHGGIGTLHNATEAGCPSVIITYGHDQHYNAKTLKEAGISSGSIDRKEVNPENLANLINEALEDKLMKQKAEQISLLMKEEDGVKTAIDKIEKMYQTFVEKSVKVIQD
jgi:UDP:flavonoid glycosyltransferase YjiC (YdhE family)